MTSPLDLNDFLAPLLASGSLADLQGLIDLSLQPKRILVEIALSKRYEALSLFLPLLRLQENEEGVEVLAKMMAEEVLAENAEVVSFLQQHLQGYVHAGDLAFYCGQLATVLPTRESLAYNYQFCEEYHIGLVSADNLDLFLIAQGVTASPASCHRIAGKYCAKRMMDHFGYSTSNSYYYIFGAFAAQNQDTIRHLFERVEDKDYLRKEIATCIFLNAEQKGIVPFVQWLLKEGFLQLSEEHWTGLKLFLELYTALQADV